MNNYTRKQRIILGALAFHIILSVLVAGAVYGMVFWGWPDAWLHVVPSALFIMFAGVFVVDFLKSKS